MKIRADLAPSGRGSQVKFCTAAAVVARSNALPLAMQEDAPQRGKPPQHKQPLAK